VDARRQLSIQNAPQVLCSNKEPPLELRGEPGVKEQDDMSYITFGKSFW
jgi:actin related protein 2/3 complex subunit 2